MNFVQFNFFSFGPLNRLALLRQSGTVVLAAIAILFAPTLPAFAHHPLGGATPSNAVEGFLSGLGHPIIGLDHFTFVIAAGLLAAAMGRGGWMPLAFVVASILGTGLHLINLTLPLPELVITSSVLLFGLLLALGRRYSQGLVIGLGAIAGIFHGYAYGESIFGAEMGPLVAYLMGFASIQLVIAAAAQWAGQALLNQRLAPSGMALRFAGFVICGVGATFFSNQLLGYLLPL